MDPQVIKVLEYCGQAFAVFLIGGLGHLNGKRGERKKNNNWDGESDPDRRNGNHTHKKEKDQPKPVTEDICSLRHENVTQRLDTIVESNTEIKRDIRSITKQLSGAG
ncbi:MAG: hypothetical protein KAS07_04895 [Candidatus Pacebacteria bacterium]|nr:hypothetical protein [Candidatus Paceibacterota bacterium]